MTINEFLAEYAPVWRGHTPGHKGKLDPRDITEVPDVFPADLIEQAEARAAKLGPRSRFGTGMLVRFCRKTLLINFTKTGAARRA